MKSLSELGSLLLTPERLRAEGLEPTRSSHWVASGLLTRIRRGVYVRTSAHEQLRHEDLHRLKVLAYAITARRPPVFCRESAALLHGCAVKSAPSAIHVLLSAGHGHRAQDVAVHRRPGIVPSSVDGYGVTSLLETLVDCALALPRDEALVIVESALWRDRRGEDGRPGLSRPDTDLQRAVAARVRGERRQGHRRAKDWLPLLGSLSESPGETLTKSVLRDHRLPRPEQQYRIGGRRVDFAWPERHVVLEFDGEIKYADDSRAAEAIRAERRRHQELVDAEWTVVRTCWEEVLHHPWTLVGKLRRAGVGA